MQTYNETCKLTEKIRQIPAMPNIEYMLLQVEITNYNLTAGKNSINNAIFLM